MDIGAGAGVCFGSGLVDRGGVGQLVVGAAARGLDGARRRGCRLGRDHPACRVLVSASNRYRPREFGIHESDGAPGEQEGRPKHQSPGYQACMMVRWNVASASGKSFPPDAGPPRCAQLMGLASRGCLVFVLGATAERRNLFFRSDLGLPWIRTSSLRLAR